MSDKIWPALRLKGEGCRRFLNGQTTTDVLGASDGAIFNTCRLNTKGNVREILEIRLNPEGAELIVVTGDIYTLEREFQNFIFPADKLSIESIDSIRRIQTFIPSQFLGTSKILWLDHSEPLPGELEYVPKAQPEEINLYNYKNGFPLGNSELEKASNPFELGLSNLIDPSKGCYLGQEAIARISKMKSVKKQIRYWESDSKVSGQKVLIKSSSDKYSEDIFGEITSVQWNPLTSKSFGFALVRKKGFSEERLLIKEEDIFVNLSMPRSSTFL